MIPAWLLLCSSASAQAPAKPSTSLSVQLLEVISLERGHIATVVAPGVSLRVPVNDRWSVVGIVSPIVGIDQTSLGGVVVVTPQARVWHRGPWHASAGPTTSISVSYEREETWSGRTNLSAGVGGAFGRKGTVAQLGLDLSASPTFEWALGLVPRIGITAAL
ncbi:MAG: hypothetical protein KTR31_18045 [Myxococcales bacterium]|nr:hypothetical protein [Myxococcales bacterium]